MLQVMGDKKYLFMSKSAHESLTVSQIDRIEKYIPSSYIYDPGDKTPLIIRILEYIMTMILIFYYKMSQKLVLHHQRLQYNFCY